jgi:hypothetical protein
MTITMKPESRNGSHLAFGPRVEQVLVTPELAAAWLLKNKTNRRLIKAHLEALEQVLIRGEWVLNGDTIRFGKDGEIKDGQHRLNACVNTGVSFLTFVVYDLDENAFDTIDTLARPRKAGDVLSIHGKSNCNTLAACVRFLWIFKNSFQFYDGGANSPGFSPRLCLDIIERRPLIEFWVRKVGASSKIFPSPSVLSALCYLFSSVDSELSEQLLSVVSDGSGDVDRPFNLLRETMINRRMSGVRVYARAMAFMTVRAWNSEISESWVKKLYYKPNEEFPAIAGLDYDRLYDIL